MCEGASLSVINQTFKSTNTIQIDNIVLQCDLRIFAHNLN